MTEFALATALGDSVAVIAVTGELDLQTTPALLQECERVIRAGGQELVIDLSNTTFADSTALALFVRVDQRIRADGGRLTVIADDPHLVKVFHITGLDRKLTLRSSFESGPAADSGEFVPETALRVALVASI